MGKTNSFVTFYQFRRFELDTISEAYEFMGLGKPKHPLVSVFYHEDMHSNRDLIGQTITFDFYQVVLKKNPASFPTISGKKTKVCRQQ